MKDNLISEKEGKLLVKTTRLIVTKFLKNGTRVELDEKFQELLDDED